MASDSQSCLWECTKERMKVTSRKPGFISLIVLFALAAIMALVLALHTRVIAATKTVKAIAMANKALHCAQGGLELAKAVVLSSDQGCKALPVSLEFSLDDAICNLEISDEQGRLNINYLVDGEGRPDKERIDRLLRLMAVIGLEDQGLVTKVTDLLTGRIKDRQGLVRSLTELMAANGLEGIDRLIPYITVYGDGLISLNSAPVELIRAILDISSVDPVETILAKRDSMQIDDIGRMANLDQKTHTRLGQLCRIRSSGPWYRVVARAKVGHITRTIFAILHANPSLNTVDVVEYMEI